MSNRILNWLAVVMVILMAAAAFAAGYLVHEIAGRPGAAAAARPEAEQLTASEFDLFWEAWDYIDANFVDDLPVPRRVVYGAIRGAMAELGDPNSFFIEPPQREEERDTLRGNFGGIGASLSRNEAGVVFLAPIAGNPAERAGIRFDDVLLAVDGDPVTAALSLDEIAQRIRGEKGTLVTLTIRHRGETEPVDIEIERADILIPSVSYRLLRETPATGYVQLTRFSGESGGEVERALLALQAEGATQIILDLRGNPGGLLDAAVDIADHFLTTGVIVTQRGRVSEEQEFTASAEAVLASAPLVVLVDGGTASAAEILAGALQDQQRAVLVGNAPTFGKGSVQFVFDLSDGSSVHVTSSRWYTPAGRQLDQQGLGPDVLVTVTEEDIQNGRDAVLERAVEYLHNGR